MEGLFEANRLVEVSMAKLNSLHAGGELPLRKTLMISKVLNKAQNIASSAHYSLLHTLPKTPTRRSSSKLLASINKKVETSSSSLCYEDDPLPRPVDVPARARTPFRTQREPSPIVSCSVSRQENEEEAMDFESVNSVLSNILSDRDMTSNEESTLPLPPNREGEEITLPLPKSKFLSDVVNMESSGWSAWRYDANTDEDQSWCWSGESHHSSSSDSANLTTKPGKRHHNEAFPDDKENSVLPIDGLYDDSKRFKPSPPEGCPLESLPGFCGYLSPRNFQSAPLISYMFGRGFAEPSNPSSSDWPSSFSPALSSEQERLMERRNEAPFNKNHFASHFQTSSMKFSPILAF